MADKKPHSDPVVVATFYKFAELTEPAAKRQQLLDYCQSNGLTGTILLATEGINATVAGTAGALAALLAYIGEAFGVDGLDATLSPSEDHPFRRMKVKLRKEIVTFGHLRQDSQRPTGTHVAPADWNALIADPNVLVIDARNEYEVQIGSFAGAQNPHTQHFSDFPEFVEKRLQATPEQAIAMFCTGGIRCEKASAYLLDRGYKTVYQLSGGILRYLNDIPREESLWRGDCFVFDGRVALDPALQKADFEQCRGCRRPLSAQERRSPLFEPGISCHACHANLSPEQRASFSERRRQVELADSRKSQHIGAVMTKRNKT